MLGGMEEDNSWVLVLGGAGERFPLKTLEGGTSVHAVRDTPVASRHERHAQRYVRCFVGSVGRERVENSTGELEV